MNWIFTIFFFLSFSFSFSQSFNLNDTVFKVGDIYRTNGIYFGDSKLLPSSKLFLDSLTAFMKRNKNLEIEVGSFYDCDSSKQYNLAMTSIRSKQVMQFLIMNGIDSFRLTAVGYGGSKPIIGCSEIHKLKTEKEIRNAELLNRRFEFRISRINY